GGGFFLLRGDFGVGKSFALRQLFRRLADEYEEDRARPVPVLVHLGTVERPGGQDQRGAPEKPGPLEDLLLQTFKAAGLDFSRKSPDALLARGAVVLLDAFDELSLRITHDELLRLAEALVAPRGPRAWVILTSRSYLVDASARLKTLFASAGDVDTVGEFGRAEVVEFLGKHGRRDPERDADRLHSVDLLWEMARRPVLLRYLAGQREGQVETRIDDAVNAAGEATTRAQLVERCVQCELDRVWHRSGKPPLTKEQVLGFDRETALRLWRDQAPGVPAGTWLRWLDNVLPAEASKGEQVGRFLRRVAFLKERDNLLVFSHRAIEEFFLADALQRSPDATPLLRSHVLKAEAGRFFADLAGPDRTRKLADELLRRAEPPGPQDVPGAHGRENALLLLDAAGGGREGLNLEGADLTAADLTRLDLSGANLSRARLAGLNLRGRDLRAADLRGAD
ncbi:MAG: pentapeptide repeat-containing protein, partial [Myxococcota bacterium]|nr:pentapeptide repeat-containing protein [Myxococcota bacterium]